MIRELLGFKRWNLCSLLGAPFVRHSAGFAAVCDIAVWCLGTKKNDPTLYLFAVALVAVVASVVDLVWSCCDAKTVRIYCWDT